MALEISYRTKKLEKACTKFSYAVTEYGDRIAVKIHQRIGEIQAADSVESLIQFSIGGCHALTGNRAGQYAMTLVQPYRLVFIKDNNGTVCVKIVEIVDYH